MGTSPLKLTDLVEMAHRAKPIIKEHFADFGMRREVKGDSTPVTIADIQINDMVIHEVCAITRHVGVIGEERTHYVDSPWQVLCDPIDGTFPYTWGAPISTFMIGLRLAGVPVMGVIYDPFMDRMYTAEKGKGAYLGKRPLKVSGRGPKNKPTIGIVSWPGSRFNVLKAAIYLEKHGVASVNLSSVGYVETLVANGELDGSLFPSQKFHDTLPGHVLVEEAGGTVTDVHGNPIDYTADEMQGHIMSNGVLHDIILEAVRTANA